MYWCSLGCCMKFLVVGDLHGQSPRVVDESFDAVIVPGDVCGDAGIKPLMMQAVEARTRGEDVVDWWDLVSREEASKLVDESIEAGRAVLKRLDSLGVPVFIVPGNWDWTGHEDVSWELMSENLFESRVIAGFENVVNCEDAVVEFEGVSLVGYGRVNGPELVEVRGYADVSEEELFESREHFEELVEFFSFLFEEASNPVVFLAHNVPYGTSLDVINNVDSAVDGMHYGSNVVRELVERFEPLITIGGHIHEHYGTDEVGDSVCLNAGFGSDKATIVEITDGELSVRLLEN